MSNGKRLQNQYRILMICMINLGQEKNVLVLVIGRVDFDANKNNAGRKINTTPVLSSPVNHRHPRSSVF